MTTDPGRVKELFVAALDLADPRARQEFLDRKCAGDADLRRRLSALFMAHDDPAIALGQLRSDASPVVDPYATGPEAAETPPGPGSRFTGQHDSCASLGMVIAGRYKLLQELGEGGMGTVWVAEQAQPVRRKVAVKLIKAGMDSKTVLSRFDAERQALALMDHPHIAKVLDGGTTENGRPFFVMEYVKGVPFTQYCDDARLSIAERLALFVPVCQAVQHAHQKGIIHRDLKPSNILVCLYDGRPVPKVIDFGLAKAMHQPLTEHTLYTAHGLMMGTPLYMSPEQAGFNNLDVDTRTDIYALGVILYEVLTGTTPVEKQRFQEAAWQEMLRLIKDEDPPKPSARLSGARTSPGVAAQRGLEPVRLARLVKGELDWIVMKCLEKERSRRYDTANGLVRDIQRYLADEAVEACPPSARYRIGKFARKNRTALTTVAALAVFLLAGAAVSTWQAVRARRAEAAARGAEGQALAAEKKAVAEKSRADEEAAVAKAVNDFLRNDMLAEAAPDKNARVKKVTVEEVLGRAAARIASKFPTQPRIEAAIRQTIGDTYFALGDYTAAQPHLERAVEINRRVLGEEHADTLTSMNNLGCLYRAQGQLAKAESLFLKALEVSRRVLGEEHPGTLTSMHNLAGLYLAQGQYAKAEPLYVKTLEVRRRVLGEEHADTLTSMNNLAALYLDQGQLSYDQAYFAKAEPLYVMTLEIQRRVLGEEHPNTLDSMKDLADLYQVQGRYAKAEPLCVKTLEVQRRVLGEEHPSTLISMNNLAVLYWSSRKFDLAIPLYQAAWKIQKTKLGPNHPDTLNTMANLGINYRDAGRLKDAVPLLEDADRRIQALPLANQHSLTWVRGELADAYVWAGQPQKGESLLREQMKIVGQSAGLDSTSYADALARLGQNLVQQKKWAEAEPVLRECLTIREKKEADDWTTFNTKSSLGDALLGQKKYVEAELPLMAGYEGMKERAAKIPLIRKIRLVEALERLVRLYEAMSQKGKAAEWRQKLALENMAAKLPATP